MSQGFTLTHHQQLAIAVTRKQFLEGFTANVQANNDPAHSQDEKDSACAPFLKEIGVIDQLLEGVEQHRLLSIEKADCQNLLARATTTEQQLAHSSKLAMLDASLTSLDAFMTGVNDWAMAAGQRAGVIAMMSVTTDVEEMTHYGEVMCKLNVFCQDLLATLYGSE